MKINATDHHLELHQAGTPVSEQSTVAPPLSTTSSRAVSPAMTTVAPLMCSRAATTTTLGAGSRSSSTSTSPPSKVKIYSESTTTRSFTPICGGCGEPIGENQREKVVSGVSFHDSCFGCTSCGEAFDCKRAFFVGDRKSLCQDCAGSLVERSSGEKSPETATAFVLSNFQICQVVQTNGKGGAGRLSRNDTKLHLHIIPADASALTNPLFHPQKPASAPRSPSKPSALEEVRTATDRSMQTEQVFVASRPPPVCDAAVNVDLPPLGKNSVSSAAPMTIPVGNIKREPSVTPRDSRQLVTGAFSVA
ncbi:unnamed protein product, partial [Amoebophrya sp. A120]|eukprot:GSA120T00017808001.1